MAAKVTRDVLESYLDCKTKAHLRLAGQQGSVSDYENLLVVKRQEVRQTAIDKILAKQHEGEVVRDISLTADALRAGPSIMLDTNLEDGLLSVRFDGLKRVDGPSKLGDFHYVPMLFHGGRKVNKEQRLLLELFGLLLSQVQGRLPASGVVWHGRACRASKLRLNPDVRRAERPLREVKEMIGVESPPRLILNDHCRICEFRRMCQATAVEKDDLSLLRGLPPKDIAGLNRRGIFTVTQYSYTFRPGRLKRAVERKSPKYDHSLQALAVRDNTVYVVQRPELPEDRARLYLDVEGLPDADSYYLIGLTVEEGGTQRRLCFWADHGAEEAVIWRSFLEVAGSIEDFVLFHYGSYESHFLKRMEARHGGDPRLIAKLKSRSVNVLSLIYGRVYFPAYSNDLKSVAGCLGCCWAAADASGLQSIVWRHGWEAARDEAVKQRLLAYNEEDRSALSTVVELLRFVSSESQPGYIGTGPRVAAVEDIEVPRRHKFCDPEYVLPELNRITKCAYFDYQRDKVLFRTSPTMRRSIRRKKRRERRALKVDREIDCGHPAVCPHCSSTRLSPHYRHQKIVFDLKPSRAGIKRWVTRYKARRCRCGGCGHTSLPAEYLAVSAYKYGPGLCSWVVYSSISQRQTNEAVAEALNDLFAIHIPLGSLADLLQRVADRYRPTYESLIACLRSGQLIHADETKTMIKGSSRRRYVWAFANSQTVVYVYSPTRDGDTPKDTLAGFHGVLVSDFYSAYDSLDCLQQKCLIHLVRDLNDDLLKHPFDAELKRMTVRFAGLLQAVVETIDRYGLKKYHLHKHKKDVGHFYAAELAVPYQSGIARHYQDRFLKYRDKLFTFLDHDGVPWNNNNAENAIKRFVSRRKIVGSFFSEDGLRQYLQLLSIYQTLRYRGFSFWTFLLSGETDITAFTAKGR